MISQIKREQAFELFLAGHGSFKLYIDPTDNDLKEAIISSTSINSLKKSDACIDGCWKLDPVSP